MAERRKEAFRVGFDRPVKIEFRGAQVTSDAGLLAFRDLDEALGLTEIAAEFFTDTRTGRNARHGMVGQLRQSVYNRLPGYEDTNVAEQLCNNPAMCCLVGGGAARHPAASTSQMGQFETDVLTQRENLRGLMELSGRWIDRAGKRRPTNKLILDEGLLGQPDTRLPGRGVPSTATSAVPVIPPAVLLQSAW